MTTDASAIALQGLQFAWPGAPPILDIESFAVPRGAKIFLSGPSGSGKSTLLGVIGGVLRPQRGSVRVLGADLGRLSAAARDRFRGEHLGFIFQLFNLIPYLSVLDNVMLPGRFVRARARRAGPEPHTAAARLLASLGLGDPQLQRRPVTQLSIGQQQRVAAARALFGSPELVIADEPTSALDHDARADFLRLLTQECARSGATLLFVSHDTSLASMFDRSLALTDINRGRWHC
ncbi:MAG: ABC transporter ATP-binding protein [Steroidobacteraceae bacterium]|nr:ABC transporter ATP-binding protein [Steroidobacteraceae bacterium]MDW8258433.1 ABC transporter ATP-binding protein [Gammaproteobacteria bacterium]